MLITQLRNGSEVAEGLDRGDLDVGLGGHLQTLSAVLAGSRQSFFASLGFEEDPDHLPVTMVVGAKGANRGFSDGATIAMSARAAISDLQVRIFAAGEGVDYSSLRIVTMPFAEMQTALANGDIDCASVPDPFASQIESAGVGVIVDRGTLSKKMPVGGRVMITGIVSTRGWIEDHRQLASRVTDVVERVVNRVAVPDATHESVQQPTFDTRIRSDDLQLAFDLAAEYGVVSGRLRADTVVWNP